MKAIILARVSTEEQKEAGNSLPAQLDRIKNYCKQKNYTVIETFSFDESAYKAKREEFDKIIECIKGQKEKVAVCFDKVDRLSRNVFDKRVSVLHELAMKDEIELHFVSDNLAITSEMSATEKFHFGINLGLAKYYSDAISDSVKRSYEKMRANGAWTSSRPPIGYMRHTNDKGLKDIIPDPKRAHLVIKLFELYSTGNHSLETLREESGEMGFTSTGNLKLPKSTIENLIKNPFYHGVAMTKKYGPYNHKYERLITKELFDRCQEIREGKRTNRPKFVGQEYIFKGLLRCENCGCVITPEMHKKNSGLIFIYYSCTNAKGTCKREYVSEKNLLEPIYDILELFENIREADQEFLVKELNQTTEQDITFHKAQIVRIVAEQNRVKQMDDGLLEVLLDRSITKDIYDKKHQEFQDRLQTLSMEYEEHSQTEFNHKTAVDNVFSVARRARKIFEGSEISEKRDFLNYLLQNPTVQQKNLYFSIRSPFDLVLELATSPSLGGYRDSNPN